MDHLKLFIHLFTTPGGYYIYDVNKNAILRTTRPIYELLQRKLKNAGSDVGENTSDCDAIEQMKEDGFLSPKRIKEVVHPYNDTLPYYLENKLNSIILQVTQQCNFRCQYCIYSGDYTTNRTHSNKRMSLEIAFKGIDFLMAHSCDSESVNVGFYGGEPLLEFDLIKNCVEYIENTYEGKNVTYSITTNGTLLNKEIVRFFMEHNVNMAISLDGPREIHNKSRKFAANNCGTFDAVIKNIEMIGKEYPEYINRILFNIVVDEENNFSCVDKFFLDYDTIKNSQLSLQPINPINKKTEVKKSETFYIEYGYETFKLFLHNIGKLAQNNTSRLINQYFLATRLKFEQFEKHTESLPDKSHHGGPCITGVRRLFVDVNGYLYPCERVSECSSEMKIGHIDTGFEIEKARNLLNIGKLNEDSCKNCWSFMYCQMCAVFADSEEGLSGKSKTSYCNIMRASVENLMKDYCTLKELGYVNENKNELLMYS